MPRPRYRNLVYPALALLLSVVAVVAVLEAGLRIAGYNPAYVNPLGSFHEYDPALGRRGRRDFTGRFKRPEFDVVVAHNADGFRRQEFVSGKEDSRSRHVFVFGDSYTWGWGVDQGEVFTDVMNRLLPGRIVENFGINGSGTVTQWVLFEQIRGRVRPDDTVIVMFYNNDFDDNVDKGQAHGYLAGGQVGISGPGDKVRSAFTEGWSDRSYLFNFLRFRANLYKLVRKRASNVRKDALMAEVGDNDPRFRVTREALLNFKTECEKRRADFNVVFIPGQAELGEMLQDDRNRLLNEKMVHRALLRLTSALGIDTLDLLPYFMDSPENRGGGWTFRVDGHWNRKGHEVVAGVIAAHLENKSKTGRITGRR